MDHDQLILAPTAVNQDFNYPHSPVPLALKYYLMPFRKLLRRFKDDFKHRLGLNSRNASTTSLPDMHMTQPSPSPVPQASSRAAIPLSHVPFSSGYAQSLTDIPSTATATPLSRRIVTSVLPSPDVNVLSNLWHPWLPGSATPTSAPPNVYIQKNKGMSLRWRRKTAWAGLQRLMMILESSADAFGPLKLAIDGLSQCVDVFEVCALAWIGFVIPVHL